MPDLQEGVEGGVMELPARPAQGVFVDDHKGVVAPGPDVKGDPCRAEWTAVRLEFERTGPIEATNGGVALLR